MQVADSKFLIAQGDARTHRTIPIPAYRGSITDRRGEPLAVSTPVTTIWGNPKKLLETPSDWPLIAELLSMDASKFAALIEKNQNKEFIYLKRRTPPEVAEGITLTLTKHKITNVHTISESKRFYPSGSLASHVVGFTDIDDKGSEGVELSFNESLQGRAGAQLVIKNRRGGLSNDLGTLRPAQHGQPLVLSIDLRLQHIAKRELERGINETQASAGSALIMDVNTGEILSLVNYPTYNPNNRDGVTLEMLRNRGIVDVFEPASTMKPFSMAAALESGRWKPNDFVNVGNGTLTLGKYTIRDLGRYASPELSMTDILIRSSNVGISKVAFEIGGDKIQSLFQRLGLGQTTGLGFPGERAGVLPLRRKWKKTETATLSYGYGLSVTAVQLAKIYSVLANGGKEIAPSIIKIDKPQEGQQIIPLGVASDIRHMLTEVIEAPKGIYRAKVKNYHVAGKSGTARKSATAGKGYSQKSYRAIFAGFAPANNPRFAVVVIVDNPTKGGYFGGLVSAPIFSRICEFSLRLYNVPPDNMIQETNTISKRT